MAYYGPGHLPRDYGHVHHFHSHSRRGDHDACLPTCQGDHVRCHVLHHAPYDHFRYHVLCDYGDQGVCNL